MHIKLFNRSDNLNPFKLGIGFLLGLSLALGLPRCQSNIDCQTVRDGEFLHVNQVGGVDTRITRTAETQVEVYEGGGSCTFSVSWLNACQYRLVRTSGDNLCYTLLPESKPVVVSIVRVSREVVEIKSEVEGTGYVTTGRLVRVN